METRKKQRRLENLLFAMVLVTASSFSHPVDLDNVSSRFFMVSSVVDYGSLSLGAYKDQTIDTSSYGGRYYSNKSIGTAVLGVPIYWVVRQIPPFRNEPPLTLLQRVIVREITTTLPFAILAITMFRVAIRLGAASRIALWMVLAYSFGTIAIVHASMFSGHQTAASFGFFAFAVLIYLHHRATLGTPPCSRDGSWAVAAGVFAGVAALADYTSMFTAAVLATYAICARLSLRVKLAFLSGGALCASFLAWYNWRCFGSPVSISYSYQTLEAHRQVFDQALFGFGFPSARALFGLLGSPSRGLLFIMPVFIFSLYGIFRWWNLRRGRAELYVVLAIVLGYLTIISSFRSWHGSTTYGPRFLVPMLPFLAVPMIFANLNSRWFWLAFVASTLLVAPAVIGLPEVHESIRNPIFEVMIPCMRRGYLSDSLGSWLGLEFRWSILVVVIFALVLGWYATRHLTDAPHQATMPWIEKLGVGGWLGVIAVTLITARTDPPELVAHEYGRALYNLGHALSARGDSERAVVHYREVLRVWPDFPEAHYGLGIIMLRLGKLPEAAEHFEQALHLRPDFPEVHNNLGMIFKRQKRYEKAVEQFQEALKYKPDLLEAHTNLGVTLSIMGRYEEALDQFQEALRIKPDSADTHNNLGVTLMMKGSTEQAIAHFSEALRIRPDFADAAYNLQAAREAQKNPKKGFGAQIGVR